MKPKTKWRVELYLVSKDKMTTDQVEQLIYDKLKTFFKEGRVEAK